MLNHNLPVLVVALPFSQDYDHIRWPKPVTIKLWFLGWQPLADR